MDGELETEINRLRAENERLWARLQPDSEGPPADQERDHLAEQCTELLRENERLRTAVEAEREACLKLEVEPLPDSPPENENDEYWNGFWDGRDALRQAIRRRTDNG